MLGVDCVWVGMYACLKINMGMSITNASNNIHDPIIDSQWLNEYGMWLLSSSLPPGVRLDENSVFELLKKTGNDWDSVAEDTLLIRSKDKRDETRNRFSTDDERLRESIRFWLKRFPYASYRWLAANEVPTELVEPVPGENDM